MNTRTVTLTVYAIEAEQIDATGFSDPRSSRFVNGHIKVKAHGEGEWHEWVLRDGRRCWPGDRVEVVVIEDDPEAWISDVQNPPAIDKRTR